MRLSLIAIIATFFFGCDIEPTETTTKGNLHIYIPESIAPVMLDEVREFLSLYQSHGAHITYTIVSAQETAHRFVYDTARIIFLPRSLTQGEKEQISKVNPEFNELIVAYDGIVTAVHPENKTEKMTTTEIKKILEGKITKWEQLPGSKPKKGAIRVYCQDSSDAIEYLLQRLSVQPGTSANFTRTNSDLQTLQSVEENPAAVGFVALSWLDSAKSEAKILNLARTTEDTDTSFAPPKEQIGQFFSPHPANIFLNYYPLKRAIYMYTRKEVNLAAGFGTYVATAEGQKIFLQCGLLPGTQKIKLKSSQP